MNAIVWLLRMSVMIVFFEVGVERIDGSWRECLYLNQLLTGSYRSSAGSCSLA